MQIYGNTAQHRKRVHRADLLGSVALLSDLLMLTDRLLILLQYKKGNI